MSQQRVLAAVDAFLYRGREGEDVVACVLSDFAESSLRLSACPTGQVMPVLRQGEKVMVEFCLGDAGFPHRVQGKVMRHDEQTCVIRTEKIFSDGDYRPLRLMDVVEIKTQLLNGTG